MGFLTTKGYKCPAVRLDLRFVPVCASDDHSCQCLCSEQLYFGCVVFYSEPCELRQILELCKCSCQGFSDTCRYNYSSTALPGHETASINAGYGCTSKSGMATRCLQMNLPFHSVEHELCQQLHSGISHSWVLFPQKKWAAQSNLNLFFCMCLQGCDKLSWEDCLSPFLLWVTQHTPGVEPECGCPAFCRTAIQSFDGFSLQSGGWVFLNFFFLFPN